MENQDKIQDVLRSFQKSPSKDIPPILEDYLRTVAKTGKTVFPWQQLKILFVQKLEQVMEQFHKNEPCDHHAPFPNVENTKFIEMRQRIVDALQRFNGAPFTVQRICELVTQPEKHYTKCDKFLRGIEKNVMVVSTVDPCGRKIVSESRALVNGLDMNGLNQQRANLNDITDGQRFGQLPIPDWPGSAAAAIWPGLPTTDNKNNSSSVNEEQSKVEQGSELKSDANIQENLGSGLAKAVSDNETENQLVAKDSVVKDSLNSDVSSTSSEPQDKVEEKPEGIDTDNVTNQEVSNEAISETVKQSADTIVGRTTVNTDSQSEGITDTKDADKSASGEKHAMEVNDGTADEPPEKRLKVDHSDGCPVPATDESRVPDSTEASSQAHHQSSPSTDHTEKPESITDTQCKSSLEQNSKSEESGIPESSETVQQPEVGGVVSGDSQSEATIQNAVQQDQLENSLQNMGTDVASIEQPGSDPRVSPETVSGSAENVSSTEDAKTGEKQQTQEVEGAGEQKSDDNTAGEVMETETAPDNRDTAVNQAADESEPMDQE